MANVCDDDGYKDGINVYAHCAGLIETVLFSLHVVFTGISFRVEAHYTWFREAVASLPLIEVKPCQTVCWVLAWCEACVDSKLSLYSLTCPFDARVEIDIILANLVLSHFVLVWDWIEEEL